MADTVTVTTDGKLTITDAAGQVVYSTGDHPPGPDPTEKPKLVITAADPNTDNDTPTTIEGTIDLPNVGVDILLDSPPTVLSSTIRADAQGKWSWTGLLKDVGTWVIKAHATNFFGTTDSNPVQIQVSAANGGTGPGPTPGEPPQPVVRINAGASVDAIQAAITGAASGSVVLASGTYAFAGHSVRLKANITVWADGVVTINGAPGAGSKGAFDGEGLAGWTVAGKAPGQGFVFNGSLINATSARSFVVANAIFNDQASNGYDGSVVRMNGANGGTICNCDFNRCGGNNLGMYNQNAIAIDGCHFVDCRQPISCQFGTDNSTGNDMIVTNCTFEGTTRAAMEMGPDLTKAQHANGTKIINNWFDRFNNAGGSDAWAMLPISLVAQGASNTEVKHNYICRGPVNVKIDMCAIEFTGTGECTDNLNDGFIWDGFMYQSGWNIHHNSGYQNAWGWANNGSGSGTLANNTNLTAKPTPWPKPTRIDAGKYYPWSSSK